MPAAMGVLQEETWKQGNGGQPPADGVQAESEGEADIGERARTQVEKADRARGRIRADEIQHGIQKVQALRAGQGHHGLCLLRHSLQHKENGGKMREQDEKHTRFTTFYVSWGRFHAKMEPFKLKKTISRENGRLVTFGTII